MEQGIVKDKFNLTWMLIKKLCKEDWWKSDLKIKHKHKNTHNKTKSLGSGLQILEG